MELRDQSKMSWRQCGSDNVEKVMARADAEEKRYGQRDVASAGFPITLEPAQLNDRF